MLGCDYLKSIKGLGMRTIINLFKDVETFEDIVTEVSKNGKYKFEEQNGDSKLYLEQAKLACSVFYYQMIYDNDNKKIKHLCEDTLWHYFRKIDTIDDLIEKNWITSVIENNKNVDYYGKNFDKSVDYCNGELDVNKLTSEKDLEPAESINKYLALYSKLLSKKSMLKFLSLVR
jgi:5'-3' exonuclease